MAFDYTYATGVLPAIDYERTHTLYKLLISFSEKLREETDPVSDVMMTPLDSEEFLEACKEKGIIFPKHIPEDLQHQYAASINDETAGMTSMFYFDERGIVVQSDFLDIDTYIAIARMLMLLEPVGTHWKLNYCWAWNSPMTDPNDRFGGGVLSIEHRDSEIVAENWTADRMFGVIHEMTRKL